MVSEPATSNNYFRINYITKSEVFLGALAWTTFLREKGSE